MKNNKKGFTLAELLIVVAIIAVLVAISIPIFTAQLRKARLATNQANARAAYAATVAQMLDENKTNANATYDVPTAKITETSLPAYTASLSIKDPITEWTLSKNATLGDKQVTEWKVAVATDGKVSFSASKTK